MYFHAFRTQKLEAGTLSAKISDRLLPVLVAWDVVVEVCLHVLNREHFLHNSNYKAIIALPSNQAVTVSAGFSWGASSLLCLGSRGPPLPPLLST